MNEYITIAIVGGGVIIIDAVDADLARGHKWRRNNTGQIMSTVRTSDGKRTTITLARLILTRVLERELEPGEAATTWSSEGRDLRRANVVLRSVRYARSRAYWARPR